MPEDPQYRRRVMRTVLVGVAATSFPISVFGASLPTIARDLGTSESTITWVITAPILGFAVAMPVLGKLGDLNGHRRVYLVGFSLATLFAALTALAWNAPSLIVLRTLGQATGAATGPSSMALIMSVFPREQRAKAIGWWSLVVAGAPTIGLVVGGPLIDLVGWRVLFVAQAIPAAAAVVMARPILPETPTKGKVRFDVSGSMFLALGVAGALYALNRGAAWTWSHPTVLAAFVIAPIGIVAFLWNERRVRDPLLPLQFFARRNFSAPIVAQVFMQSAYMGGFILAPFLLDKRFGYTATGITLLLVLRPISFSASGPVAGNLSVRIGERATGVIGASAVASSMVVLAAASWTGAAVLVALGLALSGAGNGLSRPPFTSSIANAVDDSDLGIATASQNVVGQIGAATGITVLTTVQGGGDAASSFVRAFLVGAVIASAAIVAAAAIRSSDRAPVGSGDGGGPAADPEQVAPDIERLSPVPPGVGASSDDGERTEERMA